MPGGAFNYEYKLKRGRPSASDKPTREHTARLPGGGPYAIYSSRIRVALSLKLPESRSRQSAAVFMNSCVLSLSSVRL